MKFTSHNRSPAQRGLAERDIIDVDVALRVPAVQVNGNACLRCTGREREAELRIAAATRPVRGTALYAQVGIWTVNIG